LAAWGSGQAAQSATISRKRCTSHPIGSAAVAPDRRWRWRAAAKRWVGGWRATRTALVRAASFRIWPGWRVARPPPTSRRLYRPWTAGKQARGSFRHLPRRSCILEGQICIPARHSPQGVPQTVFADRWRRAL